MRLAFWIAAALAILLLCAPGNARVRDSDGRYHLTEDEKNMMLSAEDRKQLLEVMGRARRLADARRASKQQRRWSPTNTYAPAHIPCPAKPEGNNYVGYIRNASSNDLHPLETDYMRKHRQAIRGEWKDWLSRAGLDGDGGVQGGLDQFLEQNQPKLGIGISGGGYRAMLVGLSVLQGFDGRNQTAKERGVGGVMQLADYTAGLSGGSWAVAAMAMNDWQTPQNMMRFMDMGNNLVFPKHNTIGFYTDLFNDVDDKKDANFPVSITDYWGRAESYHLLDPAAYPERGQRTTISDYINITSFKNGKGPLPIVLSIGRDYDEIMINQNATYFEFTPFEFGSWQPALQAFFPVGYLGSDMNNGEPAQNNECVSGFDNLGFTVGTSSTLFNGAYTMLLENNVSSILGDMAKSILEDVGKSNNDVAPVPNPFKGYRPDSNQYDKADFIDLVDGGEANQNIPFEPLMQPARGLDLVIGIDAGTDTSGWPNGSSVVETWKRSKNPMFSYMAFPNVPDTNTFVNLGLNTHPTFFGCNASDYVNADSAIDKNPPVVVYVPNYPYVYQSNTSTYQLSYSDDEVQGILDNGVEIATMAGKMDDWHLCLACASILRPLQRANQSVPNKCQSCFSRYCWNGQIADHSPRNFTPPEGAPPFVLSGGKNNTEPPTTGSDTSDGFSLSKFMDSSKGVATSANTPVSILVAMLLAAALVAFM
ncbi:lysophospholipase [Malassezia nana]|uniref:Lysophospholipase n=1 Tax=Malassezia nana TaxID=180528 RepID=A0AAF0J1J0_9BASI|nr:lysophospholipase [Malassezia nana]